MSVEGINISLTEVNTTAQIIKALNTQLNVRLNDIKREINSLEPTWQSEASSVLRNNLNKLDDRFQEHNRVIQSYAVFLEETVKAYEAAEKTVNSNASAFL